MFFFSLCRHHRFYRHCHRASINNAFIMISKKEEIFRDFMQQTKQQIKNKKIKRCERERKRERESTEQEIHIERERNKNGCNASHSKTLQKPDHYTGFCLHAMQWHGQDHRVIGNLLFSCDFEHRHSKRGRKERNT